MPTAKETLTCAVGNHTWKRDAGKRGRKPTHCPKHKPTPVASNSTVTLNPNGRVLLHCELGNHDWERAPSRGAKPRNCPEHKPETATQNRVSVPAGPRKLHCKLGDHDWERPAKRGRVPENCPEHTPISSRTQSNPADGPRKLWCEIGKHEWLRDPKRGRVPTSCPEHKSVPGTDNRGPNEIELKVYPDGSAMTVVLDQEFFNSLSARTTLPKVPKESKAKTPAELKAERDKRSHEIVDTLEANLRARGTHISQNPDPSTRYGQSVIASPYVLYRKVSENVARDSYQWEMVEHHTPLQREQFLNKNEAAFAKGEYRYERGGIVVPV